MMLPCEVAVKSVIPAIRAELVKILYFEFKVKQTIIAKLLGISQPAVSHYIKGIRGAVINLEEYEDIMAEIRKFAEALRNNNLGVEEKLEYFCKICAMIRVKGLLCEIHKKYDAEVAKAGCKFCVTNPLFISKIKGIEVENTINK